MRAVHLALVATVGAVSFSGTATALESRSRSTGVDDRVLMVRGWTEQELERILRAFREMYEDRLGPAFRAETASSDGALRVTFSAGIDPLALAFLVNYVQYPKEFDVATRHIQVVGRVPRRPSSIFPIEPWLDRRRSSTSPETSSTSGPGLV